MLSKSRVVLTLDEHQKHPEMKFFSQYNEEEPFWLTTGLYFSNEKWEELGRPEFITVTMERGDMLSASQSAAEAIFGEEGSDV